MSFCEQARVLQDVLADVKNIILIVTSYSPEDLANVSLSWKHSLQLVTEARDIHLLLHPVSLLSTS